jgi:tetratricopeptide (TPR) repeat protein
LSILEFCTILAVTMKRFALSVFLAIALLGASHAVIKRDPMDVLRESQQAFEKKDFDLAAKLLTEAIEANPKLTPAYVLRGLANASRNKFDDAIADYSKAVELAPDDERPRLLRAAIHQIRKEYDKAIADLDFALKKEPGNSELLATRGICRAQKGDDDGALKDFDAAVKADPKNVHGWQLRGSAYSEKGEKDKALGDFKEAISLDPNNAATYLYRAHLYLVEAEPESALTDLEEVMRRAPDFPGAANDYAWTLATNPKDSVRNGHKAVEFAKKACHETDYKHAPTVDTLAASYAEAGDWEQALKWQQEALTLAEKTHPDDVKGMKERLALFKEKKPFREVPVREKKQKP